MLQEDLEIWRLIFPPPVHIEQNDAGRIDPGEFLEEDLKENPYELWIRAKTMISQKLAQAAIKLKKIQLLEEMVPEFYLKIWNVFKQKASEQLPKPQKWDHTIDLKPDFVAKDCKVYPLAN
jgi:hypothetical protein